MSSVPHTYVHEKTLRFWCQAVLPLVYDDSLSYYELLNKVVDYLNNTIGDVSLLSKSFNDLVDYVDNFIYEIENDELIKQAVDEWLEEHPEATTTVQDGSLTRAKFTAQTAKGLYPDLAVNRTMKTTFANSAGQITTVQYIVTDGVQPVLCAADPLDYGENIVNDNRYSYGITGGRFRGEDYLAYARVDGVTVHNNDGVLVTPSKDILCYKSGKLYSHSINSTTNQLDLLDYEWAITGFVTLMENGVATEYGTEPDSFTHDELQPRSFIAQLDNGNYVIGCTDGRNYKTAGFLYYDVLLFVQSLGLSAVFVYVLDGGGSNTLVNCGVRENGLINNDHRKIKTMICFGKTDDSKFYAQSDSINMGASVLPTRDGFFESPGLVSSATSDTTTRGVEFFEYAINDTPSTPTNGKISAGLYFAQDRIRALLNNSLSSTGVQKTMLELIKDSSGDQVWMNDIRRFVMPFNHDGYPVYVDTIPSETHNLVGIVNMTNSDAAVAAGLTQYDYGRSLFFNFDLYGFSVRILFTRSRVCWSYNNGPFQSL